MPFEEGGAPAFDLCRRRLQFEFAGLYLSPLEAAGRPSAKDCDIHRDGIGEAVRCMPGGTEHGGLPNSSYFS